MTRSFPITEEQDQRLRNLLAAVRNERIEQERKFPDQHLPNGTGEPGDREAATLARKATDDAASNRTLTWRHVLEEELREAFAETDPERLRAELIQVAAVALRWVGEPRFYPGTSS